MREIKKEVIFLGTIFLLIMMSVAPSYTSVKTNDSTPQKVQSSSENILGYIDVKHNWLWLDEPLKVNITYGNQTVFEFPEVGGILQMNFTVICRHMLVNSVVFPRTTKFHVYVWKPGGNYMWDFPDLRKIGYLCRSRTWEYHNITLDETNQIFSLETNGQNVTLRVLLVVYSFPTSIFRPIGDEKYQDITVVPNPITP